MHGPNSTKIFQVFGMKLQSSALQALRAVQIPQGCWVVYALSVIVSFMPHILPGDITF